MDLQTRKIEFVQEFLKVQSEEVIAKLEKILRKEIKSPEKDIIKPMSVEELNARIDKSISDSENGRLTKASDLKANVEKWK